VLTLLEHHVHRRTRFSVLFDFECCRCGRSALRRYQTTRWWHTTIAKPGS